MTEFDFEKLRRDAEAIGDVEADRIDRSELEEEAKFRVIQMFLDMGKDDNEGAAGAGPVIGRLLATGFMEDLERFIESERGDRKKDGLDVLYGLNIGFAMAMGFAVFNTINDKTPAKIRASLTDEVVDKYSKTLKYFDRLVVSGALKHGK